MTSTTTLLDDFGDLILEHIGSHQEFSRCDAFETATTNSLIFIQDSHQLNKNASAVITTKQVADEIAPSFTGFIAVVNDVRLAQALIKQAYDDYESRDPEWPEIHASATIHESVIIGQQCRIGPNVVLGKDVVIGDNVIIRANSVIEFSSTIGNNSIINTNVTIGHGSIIGKNVIIQSGVVIGGEGYGYAQSKNLGHVRIPHTGHVEIQDDVSIGNNTCIDRGTYGATVIRRGTKVDNLCHIAHNVSIGEDCLITAQAGIAGSAKIGNRVITSGQTGILDHKTVADDAVLVHRAAVIDDIPSGGMWGGVPARPFKEHVKRINLGKSIERRFAKLEEKLNELQNK